MQISIKAQLHCHTNLDPIDHLAYSPIDAIDKAKEHRVNFLSFTHHQKYIFDPKWAVYAKKHGILLVPGIEFEIEKKHIVGINITPDIEKIKTFHDLKKYREKTPNCLIIAAHPYFPGSTTLKNQLEENIDLFDAIEYSYFFSKSINCNDKAQEIAKKYQKPLIATSDCHILQYFDQGFITLNSELNTEQIIRKIKDHKHKNHTSALTNLQLIKILTTISSRNLYRQTCQALLKMLSFREN